MEIFVLSKIWNNFPLLSKAKINISNSFKYAPYVTCKTYTADGFGNFQIKWTELFSIDLKYKRRRCRRRRWRVNNFECHYLKQDRPSLSQNLLIEYEKFALLKYSNSKVSTHTDL